MTAVVMPGMTGVELARRLTEQRPDLGVVLMSGYPQETTLPAGAANRRFIAKPFTPDTLGRAVRELLHGKAAGPGKERGLGVGEL